MNPLKRKLKDVILGRMYFIFTSLEKELPDTNSLCVFFFLSVFRNSVTRARSYKLNLEEFMKTRYAFLAFVFFYGHTLIIGTVFQTMQWIFMDFRSLNAVKLLL